MFSRLSAALPNIHPGHSIRSLFARTHLVLRALAHNTQLRHYQRRLAVTTARPPESSKFKDIALLEWPYICSSWEFSRRIEAFVTHYEIASNIPFFLVPYKKNSKIIATNLQFIFPELIAAIDSPPWFTREGELVLNLFIGELRVASIAFSLGGTPANPVIYVGAIQGIHSGIESEASLDIYRQLTKAAEGLRPRSLLITLLKFLALEIGANELLCVSNSYRHHRHNYFGKRRTEHLQLNYDEIWLENGGILDDTNRFYRLPIEIQRKDESLISSKKRAMYRRRYALLDSIQMQVRDSFGRTRQSSAQLSHME